MHRNKLKKLLDTYNPTDEEKTFKVEMLNFLEKNTNCFERSSLEGHFTASAFLLNKAKDQALLMHHKKLDKWMQLGGHCDGDSDVLQVAIKEAQEESGIKAIEPLSFEIFDIDIHKIPERGDVKEHLHYDVRFILRVISDESFVGNQESYALKWFSKNSANVFTNNRSVLRLFEKWA